MHRILPEAQIFQDLSRDKHAAAPVRRTTALLVHHDAHPSHAADGRLRRRGSRFSRRNDSRDRPDAVEVLQGELV
jgi:hypothetical protein